MYVLESKSNAEGATPYDCHDGGARALFIVGALRELPSDPRLLGDAHAGLCEPPGAHCEDEEDIFWTKWRNGRMAKWQIDVPLRANPTLTCIKRGPTPCSLAVHHRRAP